MVRGLKRFIEEKVPDALELVAIDEKIDKWKCDNNDESPIIVIDFSAFYRSICNTTEGQLDVLFGKHERLLNSTEATLQRFKNMGVQLKFYCGGPPIYAKNRYLVYKRTQEYLKHFDHIMEMIQFKRSPEYIVQHLKGHIYNNASFFVAAVMLAEKYGCMQTSFHNECVRDIAVFASRHNAMAVLSGNSDFILIKGQWSFWDVHKFNSTEFKVLQVDKIKVRDFLELDDDELSLVGVLTSKHFPGYLVNNFLKRLGNIKNLVTNVAIFIIKNFRNKTLMIPIAIAQILSPIDISKNAHLAEEMLKLYANRIDPESEDEDELSTVVQSIHISYVYQFLNDLPVPVQPLLLCKSAYRNFVVAACQILQRQMGIVLQHKGTEQRRIIISCDQSNISNQLIAPVYPAMKVPSLLYLYQKSGNGDLLETKLKLLSWIASDQLKYTDIENTPKQYLCAVLALKNMTEHQFIKREEADCILYCLQQYNTNPESMNSLIYPNAIAARPFQLIFLYDKFHQFMAISMNTVGLSDLLVYNQLDGVYFHHQYEKFVHMSGAERTMLLEMTHAYRIY